MLFAAKRFFHAKSAEFANEYEDSFAVDEERGVAAVADGVSSAMFSHQWADILTRSVVEEPPDLSDSDAFKSWLDERRWEHLQSIDLSRLNWMQRQKLQQVGGAYSTLLWVEVRPTEDEGPQDGPLYRYRCVSIGDGCLFHISERRLRHSFPLSDVASFREAPVTICSVNHSHDHLLEFQTLEDVCRPGDFLLLATDAVAKWIVQLPESGRVHACEQFWSMSKSEFADWVAEVRDAPGDERMRVDDTTLVMLRIGPAEFDVALAGEGRATLDGVR